MCASVLLLMSGVCTGLGLYSHSYADETIVLAQINIEYTISVRT